MITKAELDALLTYSPRTGLFHWKVDRVNVKAGDLAGHVCTFGYVLIKIDQRKWQAHRLAFLTMEGCLPPHQVDHINRKREDNRWKNLRHATHKQNHENRTVHEMRGVRFEADRGKWLVRIKTNGVTKNLGRFDALDDAIAKRRAVEAITFTHQPK